MIASGWGGIGSLAEPIDHCYSCVRSPASPNASAIPDYAALHPGSKATHPQIFRPACSQ
jgi:hypothetical protein